MDKNKFGRYDNASVSFLGFSEDETNLAFTAKKNDLTYIHSGQKDWEPFEFIQEHFFAPEGSMFICIAGNYVYDEDNEICLTQNGCYMKEFFLCSEAHYIGPFDDYRDIIFSDNGKNSACVLRREDEFYIYQRYENKKYNLMGPFDSANIAFPKSQDSLVHMVSSDDQLKVYGCNHKVEDCDVYIGRFDISSDKSTLAYTSRTNNGTTVIVNGDSFGPYDYVTTFKFGNTGNALLFETEINEEPAFRVMIVSS